MLRLKWSPQKGTSQSNLLGFADHGGWNVAAWSFVHDEISQSSLDAYNAPLEDRGPHIGVPGRPGPSACASGATCMLPMLQQPHPLQPWRLNRCLHSNRQATRVCSLICRTKDQLESDPKALLSLTAATILSSCIT